MSSSDSSKIATVYAEALYDSAKEADALQQVEEELLSLADAVRTKPEFVAFLSSPKVPFEDKAQAMNAALEGCSPVTRNFVLLTLKNQRAHLFPEIRDAFEHHCNTALGIAEMSIEAAHELAPDELESLKATLEKGLGRKVILTQKVRPELLGGFILGHMDRRWDASLVHRLGRMVKQIESVKSDLGVWAREGA